MRCMKRHCLALAEDGSNYCVHHLKLEGAPRPGVSPARSASGGRSAVAAKKAAPAKKAAGKKA